LLWGLRDKPRAEAARPEPLTSTAAVAAAAMPGAPDALPSPVSSEPSAASSAPASSAVPPAPSSEAPATRARPSKRAPPAATLQAGACDPPYYLDARGIKKFKPECL
jgi:serine/threonine-protein kinase